ncbi:MAG: hypothetical protein V1737_04320 [Chloroflexota bacterium]
MGKRDYQWRETKKPKKGTKKPVAVVLTSPVGVEVIRKGKKPGEVEEGEEERGQEA